ncbi:MAG: T9SS type A sorting domain-containing protein [Bacteroidales bacterium]|nr:T9SS type A sorting domain-containing protein [Bacteroidales bacterium]
MKKTFFLLIAFFGAMLCVIAAPLKNVEVRLTQPDGQVFNCFASGDEFYNYLHDANGFTIVKGEGGYYFYAMHDSQGKVVPSPYLINSVDPASVGLSPYVKISPEEYQQRRQAREQHIKRPQKPANRELNHGIYNNLVVFIRFAGDTYHATPFSAVDSMFNASNYESISLHNYFHHASYNQLDLRSYCYPIPDGETILSYEDIYPKEYYMPFDPVTNPMGYHDGETADREFSLLERAIYYVADQVSDTLDLDYNEDGLVDNVVFVIKGTPGEWASLLWPHRWCIYDRNVMLKGLRVYDFNLQLEQGGYFNVSTLCHEMNHSLGAPDLYHYSGGIDPVGAWDLMCGTTEPPQQISMYMKYKYGHWVDDIPDITGNYGYYEIEADSWEGNHRNAYRIRTSDPSQYIVLEYRNGNDLFDSNVPDGGLLIYRIDTRFDGNANWNGYDQFDEVYLFRPGGSVNEAGNLDHSNFCAERGRTEFNGMSSDPHIFLTNSDLYTEWDQIRNISTRGDKMSFVYARNWNYEYSMPGPENFNVHVNSIDHQFEFSWSSKDGVDTYKFFSVTPSGGLIEIARDITDTTYTLPYSEADLGYRAFALMSVSGGLMMYHSAPSETWAIIGNYETIRISLDSDSPYGTKGGEMEITYDHPNMPTQWLTIYEGTHNETEIYLSANTVATFRWNPGFDPDSEGIHVKASRLNETSQGILFDIDQPAWGQIAYYTAQDEGLGAIPPQNVRAVSNGPEIQLQWTVPTENKNFDIYRDGKKTATQEGYSYLDDKIMRSGTHNYHVESTCGDISSWNPDNVVYATAMNYYCEPPQNLHGSYFDDGHVEINWDAPAFVGHGMMAYDDNTFLEQIGSNSHKWGIRIEPKHLALFAGRPLTQIELFDCSAGQYTFTIYNGEIANNNSQVYVQQRDMEGTYTWIRFDLDEAVDYDPALPLWICVATTGAQNPIPCCDYVGDDNSCLIKSGSMWRPATQFGMYRSWMLRAYTSPIDDHDFTYNLYWGPEEGEEDEMVLGQEALTATQAVHNTIDDQRYCVTALWNEKETDFSTPVFLGPTAGMFEKTVENQNIGIYPNPVKDQLTVQGKSLRHFSLMSIAGIKILEGNVKGEICVIEMEALPSGLYLLQIQYEDGIEVVKVMKR